MKHSIKGILIIIVFGICSNVNINAQKSDTFKTIDSSKILLRKEKISGIKKDEKASKIIMPLPYYNFNSSLNASFSFLDSQNNITSKTDYSYYFDKTSNFFALKESYHSKNKARSTFWIEELKDSIGFKTNMNDSIKTLAFRCLQNFNNANALHATASTNPMLLSKKTGNTKTIQGILCEEFLSENEATTTTFWVTLPNDPWLIKIRKDLQFSAFNELTAYSSGLVMLSECYYKQTKHKQRFEVLSIDKNTSKRITTDGVKLVGGF